jgi:hypothetical protein
MSSGTATVVRVPARFKRAARTSHHCRTLHELSKARGYTHIPCAQDWHLWMPSKTSIPYGSPFWSAAAMPLVHMPRITWPWTLEPSVLWLNSIWSFYIIRHLKIIVLYNVLIHPCIAYSLLVFPSSPTDYFYLINLCFGIRATHHTALFLLCSTIYWCTYFLFTSYLLRSIMNKACALCIHYTAQRKSKHKSSVSIIQSLKNYWVFRLSLIFRF